MITGPTQTQENQIPDGLLHVESHIFPTMCLEIGSSSGRGGQFGLVRLLPVFGLHQGGREILTHGVHRSRNRVLNGIYVPTNKRIRQFANCKKGSQTGYFMQTQMFYPLPMAHIDIPVSARQYLLYSCSSIE